MVVAVTESVALLVWVALTVNVALAVVVGVTELLDPVEVLLNVALAETVAVDVLLAVFEFEIVLDASGEGVRDAVDVMLALFEGITEIIGAVPFPVVFVGTTKPSVRHIPVFSITIKGVIPPPTVATMIPNKTPMFTAGGNLLLI